MARDDHLPIWKDAFSLAVLLEEAMRRFPRYHKYALGADLRRQAYFVCRGVVAANGEREARARAGQAYAVVTEEGYLKRALRRRVLREIGWPARGGRLPIAVARSLGAAHAP